MTSIAEAIAVLDRRIADVERNMVTVRRQMAAHAVPRHMRNWLLDFVAVAEGKLEDLRGRRAELQRRWSRRPLVRENGRGVAA